MIKLYKILFAAFLLVLISSQGISTFGVSTFDTEVELNSSERSFEIRLINTGEKDLNISFSAVNVSNGEVVFDSERIVLPPSDVSGSPEGSGWYYLNGQYVETESTKFSYIPESVRGSESFDVEVLAKPIETASQNYGPDIAQLREVSYAVDMPDPRTGSTWSAGENEEQQVENPQESSSQENVRETDSGEEESGSGNRSVIDQDGQDGDSSINGLTFLLLASTLIAALYIYYEV